MEFSEQTYTFAFSDQKNNDEEIEMGPVSYKDCKTIMSALQGALHIVGESAGAALATELQNRLDTDVESFLDCIIKIWGSLRSENGATLHLPVSVLSPLTKPASCPQQESLDNEEMDLRFSFELDGSGGIFLKRRDGSARFPLQRTISDIDREEEWLPYVLTSVGRIFNETKEKRMSSAAVAWSPGLTKYACPDSTESQQLQQSLYTLTYSKSQQTYPVVVYTKKPWLPVSERTIYKLPWDNTKTVIKELVKIIASYQLTMGRRDNGEFLAKQINICGKKTVPLPGANWPLTVTFLPCLADFHSLETITQRAMQERDEDEYRIPVDESAIKILPRYDALKEKLKSLARKRKKALEHIKQSITTEPAKAKQTEDAKSVLKMPSEQPKEVAVSTKQSPKLEQTEDSKMPARKVLPDKLSQLKAISMAHTILDRPIHHLPPSSSIVREKVVATIKEQVQMEAAVRTVYDPPDRTAELAALMSNIRHGGSSRMRTIEQLTPSIRSIMDARRKYLHQKLIAGPSQCAALQLWDTFHNDIMPPNVFAELLLNIESDLELYAFYGIFRDIIYSMYLGMDTRGHLQLLCTSVQSYFSYELYAESIESMKKRVSMNTLLISTNENCDESKTPDTWINHYKTLLREIFGLLRDGTQEQIRQVIRFEDEFLSAVGPM